MLEGNWVSTILCCHMMYHMYTERRSASETAIKFALLSFELLWAHLQIPMYKAPTLDAVATCNQLNVNALIRNS